MDINRLTKNPNQGFLYVRGGGGGTKGDVGAGVHGKERGGLGRQSGNFHVTHCIFYTNCCKFTSRYSIQLPCYDLHKKCMGINQSDATLKNKESGSNHS